MVATRENHNAVTGEVTIEEYEIVPEPLSVPQSLTRAKALVILQKYSLLETVKSVVAAKALTDGGVSQIRFDNCSTFDRHDPLLAYVASVTGMTDGQLDTMFIEGEALW